jgi:hypothetical protein
MVPWNRVRILIGVGILTFTLFGAAAEITWIEVKSPNFVVLSDASQGQARRTARCLERFRSLLQTAMPKLKMGPGSPLIAFARSGDDCFRGFDLNGEN